MPSRPKPQQQNFSQLNPTLGGGSMVRSLMAVAAVGAAIVAADALLPHNNAAFADSSGVSADSR